MEEIELVTPTIKYADEIMKMKEEVKEDTSPFRYDGPSILYLCKDGKDFVENCCVKENDPEGKVPSTLYLCVRKKDDALVGMIEFRHSIDHPILSTFGGHIGYCVRPSERQKGYGTQMLALCLKPIQTFGLHKILVTCQSTNEASKKIILKNGGVFESIVNDRDNKIERYWITL